MTEKTAEKLSMKRLAEEIEELRKQVVKLEKAAAQEKAAPPEKPKAKAAGARKETTADQEHALVKALANYKATRRDQTGKAGDADTDWHEAEQEMKLLLAALRSDS
jgi:phage host-nuclease inhibitor protein Gam